MSRSPHDDPIDLLRSARPDAPEELRDRCLPSISTAAGSASAAPAGPWRTWRVIELAAAAVLLLLVVRAFIGPYESTPDPLQVVDLALRGLDRAESALVEGTTDGQAPWSLRWLDGAGMRAEHGGQRLVLAANGDVDPAEVRREIVASLGAVGPLEAMRTALLGDRAGLIDEILRIEGTRIRRLSAPDGAGARIEIDIDLRTGRVVRAERREPGEGAVGLVRTEIRYEYPAPDTVDRALFEDEGPLPTSPAEELRTICMVRLRELAMMVQTFAEDHDDAFPDDCGDLERYAQGPIEGYLACDCADGTIAEVVPHFDELPDTLGELPGGSWSTTPLFTATVDGQLLVAFVDGHVEVR